MYAAREETSTRLAGRRITPAQPAEVVELAGLRAREARRSLARSTCRGCRGYGLKLDDAGMCDLCQLEGRSDAPAGHRPYPPAKAAAL